MFDDVSVALFGNIQNSNRLRQLTADCMEKHANWFTICYKTSKNVDELLWKEIACRSLPEDVDINSEQDIEKAIVERSKIVRQDNQWSSALDAAFLDAALNIPIGDFYLRHEFGLTQVLEFRPSEGKSMSKTKGFYRTEESLQKPSPFAACAVVSCWYSFQL